MFLDSKISQAWCLSPWSDAEVNGRQIQQKAVNIHMCVWGGGCRTYVSYAEVNGRQMQLKAVNVCVWAWGEGGGGQCRTYVSYAEWNGRQIGYTSAGPGGNLRGPRILSSR